ncbi:MAG: Holliday junction branch migration protein RuvA [Bacilli bacterium]|jgi:holliday junction DNA helicase RuvA
MLDFLIGKVVEVGKDYVDLNVNNVGFKIFTSNLKNYHLNDDYTFYVVDVIKEEEYLLYGFLTSKELKLFNKLMTVNGVGSKTAMALLNNLSVDEIIYLIKSKNSSELVVIPGVGCRADRIIVELFNKLDDFDNNNFFRYENVFKALKKIGYKSIDISHALNVLPNSLNDSEALKSAIKEINSYAK